MNCCVVFFAASFKDNVIFIDALAWFVCRYVVNGPGEAKEADIGIAGGDGCAIIFRKGEILRKVSEENILDELMKEIELL